MKDRSADMNISMKLGLLASVFTFCCGWNIDSSANSLAQEASAAEDEEREKAKDAFGSFSAAVVNLRLNGDAIVYSSEVFVPNPDESQRMITETVPQSVKVMVPVAEEVDGRPATTYRIVEQTVTVTVRRMTGGTYKRKDIAIPDDSTFLSLDGKKLDRKTAMSKIGMKEVPVLLIPKGMEVPATWEQILKPDTLVLQITGPFEGQPHQTFFSR